VARPQGGWVAPLVARTSSGLCDSASYFGAGPDATNGFDAQYDVAKPPMVDMGPQVYVSFDHPEWGTAVPGTRLASDVRAQGAGTQQWTFTVTTSALGEDISLLWPDLSQLPRDARPVLTDLETGQRVAMRTTRVHAYHAHTPQRRFEISMAPSQGGALVVRATAAPSRAGVDFVCTLSRPAQLDVQILNISGRPVRALVRGQQQAAGTASIAWNARGENGLAVPSGTYLLKVQARDQDGQQNQTLVPFVVVR
jgi:hypothetical protein